MVARRLPLVVGLLIAWAAVAAAEHEVYYRFVVLGYVKDARGHPVPGQPVELIRDKTGFSYLAETDEKGFYVVIARLADENVGETLTLKVGATVTRVTARFDPANHVDARGTRVDVTAGKPLERAVRFPSTLRYFLGAR